MIDLHSICVRSLRDSEHAGVLLQHGVRMTYRDFKQLVSLLS